MSRKTKDYAKIFGILFALIGALMALFLWMNHSINQNQVTVVVARQDIEEGVRLSDRHDELLTTREYHAESLPEGYFTDMTGIDVSGVTRGRVPEGTVITSGFIDNNPEGYDDEEEVDDFADIQRTNLPIQVSPSDVSGGMLEVGDTVVFYGTVNTSGERGNWIGTLSDNAVVESISGDLTEGSASVTFSVNSSDLGRVQQAASAGNMIFLVNTEPPTQADLYEQDIFRNLEEQIGIFTHNEDSSEISFPENSSLWNRSIKQNPSVKHGDDPMGDGEVNDFEIPTFTFDNFSTRETDDEGDPIEGALFRWENISPQRVRVRHYELDTGNPGIYHGNFTLENDNASRRVYYDNEQGFFGLSRDGGTTFREAGYYQITLEYDYQPDKNDPETETKRIKMEFILEEETVDWEIFIGAEDRHGNVNRLPDNSFAKIFDIDDSNEKATISNHDEEELSQGEVYLHKPYYENLFHIDTFKPLPLSESETKTRIRSLIVESDYVANQRETYLIYENNRDDLYEMPFEPSSTQSQVAEITRILNDIWAGLLTDDQLEDVSEFISSEMTRNEASYFIDLLDRYSGYIEDSDSDSDIAASVGGENEPYGLLLHLFNMMDIFDDRFEFKMTEPQNFIYYYFINNESNVDRGLRFTVRLQDYDGNIVEGEIGEIYYNSGGE